jgi:uncharacterized surface protein with fasciclin (FAS1) repeats
MKYITIKPFNKAYLTLLPVILLAGKSVKMSNITQVVNIDKNLKTLKKGVHASDLDQLLSSTGPFTFFAPSDLAFEKLEKGTMDNLLEPRNRIKLTELLNNHIVQGKVNFTELKDGDSLTTVNGRKLLIRVNNGNVSVGDTTIVANQTKISNGVIHSVDTVMV